MLTSNVSSSSDDVPSLPGAGRTERALVSKRLRDALSCTWSILLLYHGRNGPTSGALPGVVKLKDLLQIRASYGAARTGTTVVPAFPNWNRRIHSLETFLSP